MKRKFGNWTYRAKNETAWFYSEDYKGYEVDLERKTVAEWLHHLGDKGWLTPHDLLNLSALFDAVKAAKPHLAIFTNQPEAWFRQRQEWLQQSEETK